MNGVRPEYRLTAFDRWLQRLAAPQLSISSVTELPLPSVPSISTELPERRMLSTSRVWDTPSLEYSISRPGLTSWPLSISTLAPDSLSVPLHAVSRSGQRRRPPGEWSYGAPSYSPQSNGEFHPSSLAQARYAGKVMLAAVGRGMAYTPTYSVS